MTRIPFAAAALAAAIFAVPALAQTSSHHHGSTAGHTRGSGTHGSYHGGHGGYHGSYHGGGHSYYRPHYSIGFYGGWPAWGWPSYSYVYPAPYYGYAYPPAYYQAPIYGSPVPQDDGYAPAPDEYEPDPYAQDPYAPPQQYDPQQPYTPAPNGR